MNQKLQRIAEEVIANFYSPHERDHADRAAALCMATAEHELSASEAYELCEVLRGDGFLA